MAWANLHEMNEILQLLARHGPAVLFTAVLVEQLGVPVPATPWLLGAGALAAAGQIPWAASLGAGVLGSLMADGVWFYLGRSRGYRVLGLLCRISLEPDSCVRKTQNVFARYGMQGIVLAKFIPGLSTLAPPLAGTSGVSAARFLALDGLASVLYVGGFIGLGVLFSRQLEQMLAALSSLGGRALGVLVGALALYLGYKYIQRRRLLTELKMARITADELQAKLEAGAAPVILDVRSRPELEQEPRLIRGAMHITLDELEAKHPQIPADRDIVLYCSCPNEASAAYAALLLRKKGIQHVRPLLGGIDAWRERDYPMDTPVSATLLRATDRPHFEKAS